MCSNNGPCMGDTLVWSVAKAGGERCFGGGWGFDLTTGGGVVVEVVRWGLCASYGGKRACSLVHGYPGTWRGILFPSWMVPRALGVWGVGEMVVRCGPTLFA